MDTWFIRPHQVLTMAQELETYEINQKNKRSAGMSHLFPGWKASSGRKEAPEAIQVLQVTLNVRINNNVNYILLYFLD